MKTDKPPSRGFNCPDCNRPCSLKIVESLSKKQNRKIPGTTLHTTSVKPRIPQNYTTFLNKLTPLGRRIQTPTAYSRKKLPAVDFLSFETVSEQTDANLPHSRQHSKRLSRDVVQLLLKAFINDMENSINEETPMICEWATQSMRPLMLLIRPVSMQSSGQTQTQTLRCFPEIKILDFCTRVTPSSLLRTSMDQSTFIARDICRCHHIRGIEIFPL